MRDTRSNGERKGEGKRERVPEDSAVNREGKTKRRREREEYGGEGEDEVRERMDAEERRKSEEKKRERRREAMVEKGHRTRRTKREESGPFDGAFVGSRGALRFATKIVALPRPYSSLSLSVCLSLSFYLLLLVE